MPLDRPGEIVRVLSTTQRDDTPYASYPDLPTLSASPKASPVSRRSASPWLVFTRLLAPLPGQTRLQSSPPTFSMFWACATRGRMFRPDEDRQPVAVLSHALWQSNFANDPAVIGRQIRLSALDNTVIGELHGGPAFRSRGGLPTSGWPSLSVEDRNLVDRCDHRNLVVSTAKSGAWPRGRKCPPPSE
jgi:hypothetical protein